MGSLLKFFSLTYAVTWTCFIAAAVMLSTVASGAPRLAGPAGLLVIGAGYFLVRMSKTEALRPEDLNIQIAF